MAYTYFDNLLDMLPEVPDDSILSRTVHQDGPLKVILFRFAEGQELSEHTASQPAVLYFIEGRAAVTLGGDEVRAEPGTFVHMPPRLDHSIRAESPVSMLLMLL